MAKKANKKKTEAIHVRQDLCKGCGICVAFCPKHVLELSEDEKCVVKRVEDCTACKLCEMRCPDLAIEVLDVPEQREPSYSEASEDRESQERRP